MKIGLQIKVDKEGRISIPTGYRDFYHLDKNSLVSVIATPKGLLITNPEYKTVKIEKEEKI